MGGEKYIKIFACKMEHILISSLGKLNTIKEYLRSYRIFGLKQFQHQYRCNEVGNPIDLHSVLHQ